MSEINIEAPAIDLKPVEDITDFSDNESVEVEHVNFEFEQNNKLHGIYRHFLIFNDAHCYQTIQQKHRGKRKFRMDLAFIDTRPFRVRKFAWKWLYWSLGLIAFDAVLFLSGLLNRSPVLFASVVIGLGAGAAMLLLLFFYKSSDIVYFRSQYGKVRLMELGYNRPDKQSFREFIRKFGAQIKQAKADRNLDQSQFLARELKEIRRLKDENIVPGTAYEKAKIRIFKHEAFKPTE